MSGAHAAPRRIAVVGAGSMGAGIAQLGCISGIPTVLLDVDPSALERGRARIVGSLRAGAERGRWSDAVADAAPALLSITDELDELAGAELVIEAVPERLDVKRATFERLSELPGDPVLATNTSSLMISAIASAARRPERVVGMHFFNPPERMRLVEIVAGPDSKPEALELARAATVAMGREPIDVLDRPGFLVNRCLRPFYSEGIKLLEEGVATAEQIDRIMRLGGGFRMGTFELLDLVGMDVNLEVTRSFFEQSAGEPRWKPSPTQARMVASGRYGRKTGRGFYDYGSGPHRPPDEHPPIGGGDGRAVGVLGDGPIAELVRERAREAGWDVAGAHFDAVELVVDARLGVDDARCAPGIPRVVLCAAASLARRGHREAAGFHLLAPGETCHLVELTALPSTPQDAVDAIDAFFATLGLHREWVADAPGLVLGRVVCQVINEAAFAIGEGIATPRDVDTGVVLGLNHPRGPVTWAEALGIEHVRATLDGLWRERREERYRPAPLLELAAATGGSLRRAPVRRPSASAVGGVR